MTFSNVNHDNKNNVQDNPLNFRKSQTFEDGDQLSSNSPNNINLINQYSNTISNMELVIQNLQIEISNQKLLLVEANSNTAKIKEQFQILVANQISKLKETETQLHASREDLLKHEQSTSAMVNQNKIYEVKLINSENQVKKQAIEISACQDTIKKFHQIIEEKEGLILSLKENLMKYESENASLKRKLAELKFAIIDDNLRTQIFTGQKREKTVSNFTLTFTKSDEGAYLVVYEEENNNDVILIEEIETLKVCGHENDNSVEFVFTKNKKIKTWILFMNENVQLVLRAYRDYKERSIKNRK